MSQPDKAKSLGQTVRGVPVNAEEMRTEGYRLLAEHRKTKTCPFPDCGKKVVHPMRVYCSHDHSYAFSLRFFGLYWDTIRREILKRDNHTCKLCGATHKQEPKWHYDSYCHCEVDHIIEVADGGTDDRDNLRVLCHDCHVAKTKDMAFKRRKVNHEEGIIVMEL